MAAPASRAAISSPHALVHYLYIAERSPRLMNMNLCQYHHFDLCLRDQNSCANAFNALADLLAIIAAS